MRKTSIDWRVLVRLSILLPGATLGWVVGQHGILEPATRPALQLAHEDATIDQRQDLEGNGRLQLEAVNATRYPIQLIGVWSNPPGLVSLSGSPTFQAGEARKIECKVNMERLRRIEAGTSDIVTLTLHPFEVGRSVARRPWRLRIQRTDSSDRVRNRDEVAREQSQGERAGGITTSKER